VSEPSEGRPGAPSRPGPVPEKLGWVGLGAIGGPMARRLVDRPGGLVVCDVAPGAVEPFARRGVEAADNPSAVIAAGATIVSIVVRDDDQVRAVVEALVEAASSDTVLAIHSTIAPGTAEELAEAGTRRGVHVVDAPVSGGPMGAASGRLAVLAGGPVAAVDRCRAALVGLADLVVRFGEVGAGTRAKLARNLITFASYAAVGEAHRLAAVNDLDLAALGEVVRHSDAVTGGPGAIMLGQGAGPLPADDGLRAVFAHTRALGDKDLDLALAVAAHAGLDLPVAEAARRTLGAALGVDPGS